MRARIPALFASLALSLAGPALSRAEVPGDGWLVWSSNREDGRHEVYLKALGSGAVARLTHDGGRTPRWSPDGRWISYHHPSDNTAHVVRWDGSEDHEVCEAAPVKDALAAFWTHDNSGLVCIQKTTTGGETDYEYRLLDPESGENELLFRHNGFPHLVGWRFEPGGITHDGRYLVGWAVGLFRDGYTADNGTFQAEHATVVLDIEDKQHIYWLASGCLSATPPQGRWVYHISRECPAPPDISRMSLDHLDTRESYELELGFEDEQWGHEYMPAVSNDGEYLVYAASLGCHDWYSCDYDVFLHELGAQSGERTRLVEHPGNDNFPDLFVGVMWSSDADADLDVEGDAGDAGDGSDACEAEAREDEGPEVDAVTGASPSPCGCGAAAGPPGGLTLLALCGLLLTRRRAARCARLDSSEAKK